MKRGYLTTRFALLRHAKTLWNQTKRIQGQWNSPLTPEGKEQAKAWGQVLKAYHWDRIITSDLGRALETATLLNDLLQVPLIHDSRLREQDWGQWTGKTLEKVKQEDRGLLTEQVSAGWHFCPPKGENRKMVLKRSQESLKAAVKKWPGTKILVVTHEGVIKCLIYRLLSRQFLPSEPRVIRSHYLHWIIHDEKGLGLGEINNLRLP